MSDVEKQQPEHPLETVRASPLVGVVGAAPLVGVVGAAPLAAPLVGVVAIPLAVGNGVVGAEPLVYK